MMSKIEQMQILIDRLAEAIPLGHDPVLSQLLDFIDQNMVFKADESY